MEPTFSQPNCAPIEEDLVAAILRAATGSDVEPGAFHLSNHDQYSNDLAIATLGDGRRLMVKRGRYEWSRSALENSRRAAELLHRVDVLSPRPIDLPPEAGEQAIEAYWRIELPTLLELWPQLNGRQRQKAVRSLGELMGRVHAVKLAGHGLLINDVARRPLAVALAEELRDSLLPTVAAVWPVGTSFVEKLLEMMPTVAKQAPEDGVLVHGDLHIGNVLCRPHDDGPRCVGLLDLEWVHAAPKENDLARLTVIQTRLFQMPIEEEWVPWFQEGYGRPIDQLIFRFYRLYHLVQLGLYSAVLGHEDHATDVAAAAAMELPNLGLPAQLSSPRPLSRASVAV